VDGPRPTAASVIARVQGQGTPATVASDWMRMQAEPTQAIHLVIPGHPAAARARGESGGPGDGLIDTGETVEAEPLETVGDLTGPAGHQGKGPVESRLMAQAQGRVDGTFTPSQTTARPAGLGLGRPAPAAWRKAAESVAARVAGLVGPEGETSEAEKPAKTTAAKSTKPRITKKPDAEAGTAARSTRTPKAKADAESVTKPARRSSAKADADAAPAAKGATGAKSATPAKAATPAKPAAGGTKAAAAGRTTGSGGRPTTGGAGANGPAGSGGRATSGGAGANGPAGSGGRATSGGAGPNGPTGSGGRANGGGAGANGPAEGTRGSYQAEAAELLGGPVPRRRRRTPAEAEAAAEKPQRRGRA
jgi:hypothetical protein